jgi:hypothetical protein
MSVLASEQEAPQVRGRTVRDHLAKRLQIQDVRRKFCVWAANTDGVDIRLSRSHPRLSLRITRWPVPTVPPFSCLFACLDFSFELTPTCDAYETQGTLYLAAPPPPLNATTHHLATASPSAPCRLYVHVAPTHRLFWDAPCAWDPLGNPRAYGYL